MAAVKAESVLIWILTILLSLVFIGAGIAKLMGLGQVILPFEHLGMPAMAFVVGGLEIAGAVALFIPRLRLIASLCLALTMICAIAYHLTLDPNQQALPGFILLILCSALAWCRRSEVN